MLHVGVDNVVCNPTVLLYFLDATALCRKGGSCTDDSNYKHFSQLHCNSTDVYIGKKQDLFKLIFMAALKLSTLQLRLSVVSF